MYKYAYIKWKIAWVPHPIELYTVISQINYIMVNCINPQCTYGAAKRRKVTLQQNVIFHLAFHK